MAGVDKLQFVGNHHMAGVAKLESVGNHHMSGVDKLQFVGNHHMAGVDKLQYIGNHHMAGVAKSISHVPRWPFCKCREEFRESYTNLFAAVSVEGRPCLMLNFDSVPISWSYAEQDDVQHQQMLSPGMSF
jgi:hypothetical protein